MIVCMYCKSRILDEDRRCVTCGAPAPVVEKPVRSGAAGVGGGPVIRPPPIDDLRAAGTATWTGRERVETFFGEKIELIFWR